MAKKKQTAESSENTVEKQNAPHLFQPGESGNPLGRPKGSLNFSTRFREAIEKLAKDENMTPSEYELSIIQEGLKKAKEGSFRFYQDLFDRVYGKAQQSVDLTSKGEPINNVIQFQKFDEPNSEL